MPWVPFYDSVLVTTTHFWLKQQQWQLITLPLCLSHLIFMTPYFHAWLIFMTDTLSLNAGEACDLLLTNSIWQRWWAVTPLTSLLSVVLSLSICVIYIGSMWFLFSCAQQRNPLASSEEGAAMLRESPCGPELWIACGTWGPSSSSRSHGKWMSLSEFGNRLVPSQSPPDENAVWLTPQWSWAENSSWAWTPFLWKPWGSKCMLL